MVQCLLAALLAVHLILMNVASGGPLICVWLRWRADPGLDLVSRRLAHWSLASLVLGSVLGLLMIGIDVPAQERWLAAIRTLHHRVSWGLAELAFSLACMLLYVGWWPPATSASRWQRTGQAVVAVVGATNLLYHFPPLWGALRELVHHPPSNADLAKVNFRELIWQGSIIARSVHFAIGSIAVSFCAYMYICTLLVRRSVVAAEGGVERWIVAGARGALGATLLQFPVGLWIVTALPAGQQFQVLGSDWGTTMLLVASVAISLALLHVLSLAAMGDRPAERVTRINGLMATVILLMSATLRRL